MARLVATEREAESPRPRLRDSFVEATAMMMGWTLGLLVPALLLRSCAAYSGHSRPTEPLDPGAAAFLAAFFGGCWLLLALLLHLRARSGA